jgi:pimeloyl-ACP methyl ester carboxylesterase
MLELFGDHHVMAVNFRRSLMEEKISVGFLSVAFISFAALIASVSMINVETTVLENQFINVWFSLMVFFTALQGVYVYEYTTLFCQTVWMNMVNLVYCFLLFIVSAFCFIGYRFLDHAAATLSNLTVMTMSLVMGYLLASSSEERKATGFLASRWFQWLNVLGKVVQILLYCLLVNGAIESVTITSQYMISGELLHVKQMDGKTTQIFLRCVGDVNSSLPVIWLVSSPNRGVVDFLGVQSYLEHSGHRVCAFDFPGFGWSGPPLANQSNPMLYFDGMIRASGEKTPLVMVGWAGGGPIAVNYTKLYPEQVQSLVLVQVNPPQIEYDFKASIRNMTATEMLEFRLRELQRKLEIVRKTLAVAIPWGLMHIVSPITTVPPGYFPNNTIARQMYIAQSWSSGVWLNRYWNMFKSQFRNASQDPLNTGPIPATIPLSHIVCLVPKEKLCDDIPDVERITEEQCKELKMRQEYYSPRSINMTTSLKEDARIILYTNPDCRLDLPLNNPNFTGETISKIRWEMSPSTLD